MKAQHRLFVAEYLKDRNASAAYLRAGFKNKNPDVGAAVLMAKPEIRDAVNQKITELEQKALVTAEFVIRGLRVVAERCMQAEAVMEFDKELRQMVHAKDEETGKLLWKFDSAGANRAFELLGKHLKLFTDKVELDVSEDLAERLKRARERAKKHG